MPGSQYRITIQLDLGGYSFSIYDRNGTQIRQGSHPCPVDLSVGELARELNWKAQAVSVYYTTWKYTLVPVSMYSKDAPEAALRSVRDLNPDDKVLILEMPSRKAIMIFAIPQKIYYGLTALNKNVKFYPMSYLLIDRISSITDNNRLLVSFTEGMLHIAAAERDRLLFANSFPAGDIATAEYFIFSVTKEVMFNPEHTRLHMFGKVPDKVQDELCKYFAGISFIS